MTTPLTAAAVREKYPEPRKATRFWRPGDYCVGGGFLCFLHPTDPEPFPHRLSLAAGLEEANPALGRFRSLSLGLNGSFLRRSHDFALEMTNANDAGDFERAWALLDEALRFGREEA